MPDEIIPDDLEIIAVIDKEKLPEDIRKIIEEQLPIYVQDKIFEMLRKEKENGDTDNKLFAIQTGTVVGNIYTDNIYKKEEEDPYKKEKLIKKEKS